MRYTSMPEDKYQDLLHVVENPAYRKIPRVLIERARAQCPLAHIGINASDL